MRAALAALASSSMPAHGAFKCGQIGAAVKGPQMIDQSLGPADLNADGIDIGFVKQGLVIVNVGILAGLVSGAAQVTFGRQIFVTPSNPTLRFSHSRVCEQAG